MNDMDVIKSPSWVTCSLPAFQVDALYSVENTLILLDRNLDIIMPEWRGMEAGPFKDVPDDLGRDDNPASP